MESSSQSPVTYTVWKTDKAFTMVISWKRKRIEKKNQPTIFVCDEFLFIIFFFVWQTDREACGVDLVLSFTILFSKI